MNKKRIFTLALTAILLFALLALQGFAANTKAFDCLVSFAKKGNYQAADNTFYHSIKLDTDYYYFVKYDSTNDKIILGYKYTGDSNGRAAYLELTRNLSTPYQASFVTFIPYSENPFVTKSATLYPADYTENTEILADQSTFNRMMATVVEMTSVVLYMEGGEYSLKDLGFNSFTYHVHHVDGSSVVTVPPTCSNYGEMTIYCGICGDAIKTERISPTGKHNFVFYSVVREQTCEEPGWIVNKCSACDTMENVDLPPLGHAWSLTEVLTEGDTPHTCTGLYTCSRCQQTKEAPLCAAEVFTDMPAEDHWAHNAIDWAYFNGLTSGTSATTFSPDNVLTRGQVATFLYAFYGRPEVSVNNPFTDVSENDYYYTPVLWAVENNVTSGTSATSFSPNDPCTRAQIVTFLWASAGRQEPENTECAFEDVSEEDYFYKAVLWAAEKGITSGVDATHFGPTVSCTRAQMVTFLKAASAALTEKPEDPEPTDPTDPIDPEDPTDPADPTEPEKPTELIIPASGYRFNSANTP